MKGINLKQLKFKFEDVLVLKNDKLSEIKFFDTLSDATIFMDEVENPCDWYAPDIFYADGAGSNGNFSRICYGKATELFVHTYNALITNNQAEYSAVMHAMLDAKRGDHIITDSKLVVLQIQGKWKVKEPSLIPLQILATENLKYKNLSISWVSRSRSAAGLILDAAKKYPIEDIQNMKKRR